MRSWYTPSLTLSPRFGSQGPPGASRWRQFAPCAVARDNEPSDADLARGLNCPAPAAVVAPPGQFSWGL
jgi:hypothetical protein